MGGWVGGWPVKMEIMLNSASVEVEVEAGAELGNTLILLIDTLIHPNSIKVSV